MGSDMKKNTCALMSPKGEVELLHGRVTVLTNEIIRLTHLGSDSWTVVLPIKRREVVRRQGALYLADMTELREALDRMGYAANIKEE